MTVHDTTRCETIPSRQLHKAGFSIRTVLCNSCSRPNLIGIFFVIVVLTVILAGVYFSLSINYGVDDAYALWGAADMVIDYMRTHDGDWPRNWGDLESQFNVNNGRVGGWSFEKFQDRIVIDFNANPDQLNKESVDSPNATFRVIWPKHDWGVRIGDGPDQMLCDYFRGMEVKRQGQIASPADIRSHKVPDVAKQKHQK